MTLPDDLLFVDQVARQAGAVILEHYGRVERQTKTHVAASAEAVTEADRASQRLIVSALRQRFSGDGIIGEEDDRGAGITFDCPDPDGRVWVIDPLDGTNNFVAGLGCFAVCIGLMERGEPILGVVHDVTRKQSYMASRGHGAWLDGRRISALKTPLNETTLLMVTSNLLTDGRCPGYAMRWIAQTHWKIRMLGSAALEAVQVAAGVAHGAVTVNGKLWDAAAAAAIVLEAGGIVTDLSGHARFPVNLHNYRGAKIPFLAAAPEARAELVRELQT